MTRMARVPLLERPRTVKGTNMPTLLMLQFIMYLLPLKLWVLEPGTINLPQTSWQIASYKPPVPIRFLTTYFRKDMLPAFWAR